MNLENKYSLGFFPTPLHKLKNLSSKYTGYNLFIKRDDQTGLASGGNKTRKLEYLIYDAVKNNCDVVITAGAQQSNHCRQTAAACAVAGIECYLLLGGNKPDDYDGNLLISYLLGAKIQFTGKNRKGEDIPFLKEELEQKGRKVYIVPYGGSNLLGVLGYVNAMSELKKQLDEQKMEIDYIFFASSSGATQAGITIGLDIFNINTKLVPVNIDKVEMKGATVEGIVLDLINQSKSVFNLSKAYGIDDIPLEKNYDEPGYGNVITEEKEAIKELASTEGVLLDPVYTGRAFFAMLDYLNKGKIEKGSNVLFWHTGGFPANFYYRKKLN